MCHRPHRQESAGSVHQVPAMHRHLVGGPSVGGSLPVGIASAAATGFVAAEVAVAGTAAAAAAVAGVAAVAVVVSVAAAAAVAVATTVVDCLAVARGGDVGEAVGFGSSANFH